MLLAENPTATDTADDFSFVPEIPAIRGRVILPGDETYETDRLVWNRQINRRPAVIFEPVCAADIAAAVKYAREAGVPLSVRSGGHSIPGFSTNDGGVLISLAAMKRIDIDAERKTARVQSGATAGEILAATEKYGLVLPMGDAKSVGVGGITLGGGIGWLSRKYGLTIDHLLEAEMVTADGEVVTASDDENADLFWALRGGGGNFGVVTSFTFQLREVSIVTGGAVILPATPEVITGYVAAATAAPDELTTIAYMVQAPPLPFIPAERVGELVLIVTVCHTGSLTEGEKAVAPFRALAEPVADIIAPMPYSAMYEMADAMTQPHNGQVRSMFAHGVSTELATETINQMRASRAPFSHIQFRVFGGEVARKDPQATAYAHRDKQVLVAVIGGWPDQSEAPIHEAWVAEAWAAIKEDGDGVYSNFIGGGEGRGRVHAAYPGATYCRLAKVKREYDPENVFNMNQNIRPGSCAK